MEDLVETVLVDWDNGQVELHDLFDREEKYTGYMVGLLPTNGTRLDLSIDVAGYIQVIGRSFVIRELVPGKDSLDYIEFPKPEMLHQLETSLIKWKQLD